MVQTVLRTIEIPQLLLYKVVDFPVVAMRQIPVDSPAAVHKVVDVPVVQLQRVPQVMAQTVRKTVREFRRCRSAW